MGVLCDVFIAEDNRALMYNYVGDCDCQCQLSCPCWAQYAEDKYDHIDSARLYDKEFSKLLAVLRGKTWRLSHIKQFKLRKTFGPDGPWIHQAPEDLPVLLSGVSAKKLDEITAEWIELLNNYWPEEPDTEVMHTYLVELQKLSKKAVKQGYRMYLWTCL